MTAHRTAILVVAGLTLWGCQFQPKPEVVALVNGRPITVEDLHRSLVEYGLEGNTVTEVLYSVLDELIDQALILHQAETLGLGVTQEELDKAEAYIRQDYPGESFEQLLLTQALELQEWRKELKKRLIVEKTLASQVEPRIYVDPKEIEEAVKAAGQDKADKDQIKVAQILTSDKNQAQRAYRELVAGRPFKEVAARYSSLANQAGQEIDYFGPGEMPPELERVVWDLKPGEFSKLVSSEYGYHIFLVLDRRKGGALSREKAAAALRRQKRADLQAAWLQELRHKAEIKTYPERLVLLAQDSTKEVK